MKENPELVQDRNIKETYVINEDVLGNVNPSIVVSFYPLVKGDYHTLTTNDNYETWQNNFIVAFVTAILNFFAKIIVFNYWPGDKKSMPEDWEFALVIITLLGIVICFILNKICPSSKKDLKKIIVERLGK